MIRPAISILICLFSLAGLAIGQNRSVYTSTRTRDCRTIRSSVDEGGRYEGECKGVGGYKVRLMEGDIRQTLDIVTPAKKKFELNFWSFFTGFSYIGEKIEWRTKSGVPVAIIARFNVAEPEDPERSTSYLMVAKIGKTSSCVVDIISPSPNQNKLARIAADNATTMKCRSTD